MIEEQGAPKKHKPPVEGACEGGESVVYVGSFLFVKSLVNLANKSLRRGEGGRIGRPVGRAGFVGVHAQVDMSLNLTQKLGAATPDIVVTNFRTNQDADRVDDKGSAHGCSVVAVVYTEET